MKVTYKLNSANQIIRRIGLDRGGRVQEFWTTSVARYMEPYLPFRSANSVAKAMQRGMDLKTGIITVSLPYARYLYYGKAMEGKAPKQVTSRDLHYTKTFRPKAGPFWDRRMLADKKKPLMQDLYRFLGKKGTP